VRRALGERRAGHTGTLDPFASGLLVVLLGRATRIARFVEQREKGYLAVARLGLQTTTDDSTGEPMSGSDKPVSEASLAGALARLAAQTSQRPPAFSARQVDGQRSYRLARKGKAPELPARAIRVHSLELVSRDGADITFRTVVSPGTYVRAMARDLGEMLGTGAHLTALRRESIGTMRVEDAVPMDQLGPDTGLLSPLAVVSHLAQQQVGTEAAAAIGHGRPIAAGAVPEGVPVALVRDGKLLAIAERIDDLLRPRVVLENA
jgi:tRNA pseudouridine55 synthase